MKIWEKDIFLGDGLSPDFKTKKITLNNFTIEIPVRKPLRWVSGFCKGIDGGVLVSRKHSERFMLGWIMGRKLRVAFGWEEERK